VIVSVSTATVRGALIPSKPAFAWNFQSVSPAVQCRRDGVNPIQITGDRRSGRGPGTWLCCICFCLSWYCHYLSAVQMKPFIARLRHSANESQSFWISVNTYGSPLLVGGGRMFFIGAKICSRRPCCRKCRPGKLLHVNIVGQIFASVSRVY